MAHHHPSHSPDAAQLAGENDALRPPHARSSHAGILDRTLSPALRIAILVIACLIPACYVLKHYHPQTQFTSLIRFGAEFHDRALTEIKEMKPAMESPYGYDGQFYAQIAVDPLLKKPGFEKALDSAGYRAERIFLPALAYLAGFGRPDVIVQIYALLNLLFWFLLLFGLVYFLQASTIRDLLCILAAVFTTGTLMSLQRALTDLPAATLGFYACALSGHLAWVILAMSILTRETSALFLLRFAWPIPGNRAEILSLAARSALVVTPFLLWLTYVHHTLGSSLLNHGHFGWPFRDWALYVIDCWTTLAGTPLKLDSNSIANWELSLFEFLAPLSLMIQVGYFAADRSPGCPYWRMGVGFAVMFIFLSSSIFVEQIAFCRAVLPMTIAFNIRLMRKKGYTFAFSFIAGNIGLAWGFLDTLIYCISR